MFFIDMSPSLFKSALFLLRFSRLNTATHDLNQITQKKNDKIDCAVYKRADNLRIKRNLNIIEFCYSMKRNIDAII